MVRGFLEESALKTIAAKLPDLKELSNVMALDPATISIGYPPGSEMPGAGACLVDAKHTLSTFCYSLHEAFAEITWYRQTSRENEALYFGLYFADNGALRLYAAAEQLAAAIVAMLGISQSELTSAADGTVSLQSRVAKVLMRSRQESPLTAPIMALGRSREWIDAMQYRNDWVHSQPPRVAGLPMSFKRGNRWLLSPEDGTATLPLGAGDPAEITLDWLLDTLLRACFGFVTAFVCVLDYYLQDLAAHGISISDDGRTRTVRIT